MRVLQVSLLAALCLWTVDSSAQAGSPALLQLQGQDVSYQGKLTVLGENHCWLMGQDGRLKFVDLNRVTKFQKLSPQFKPHGAATMRSLLQKEFGSDYEVAGSRHYLVCGQRGQVKPYVAVLEEVYRSFHRYFTSRNFAIRQPEFPLVVLVFPDHKSFSEYAAQEGVKAVPGLMGYYLRSSNRIALFDTSAEVISQQNPHPATIPSPLKLSQDPEGPGHYSLLPGDLSLGTNEIRASVRGTLIHEATHQLAFNLGLHTRVGQNPKWVVEGLATAFEVGGIRNPTTKGSAKSRINRDRYIWFGHYRQQRRKSGSLQKLISTDLPFKQQTLDAYAEAWALTFFLLETRPRNYSLYLKTICKRDPNQPYTAAERLQDFRTAFGKDLDWLDVEFLRFFDSLEEG